MSERPEDMDPYDLATELEREVSFMDISDARKALIEEAAKRLRQLQETLDEIDSAAQDRNTLS